MTFRSTSRSRRSSLSRLRYTPAARLADRRQRKLAVETLEPRRLLAVFSVDNLESSGPGSLSEAVNAANANPGPDTIEFAVSGTIQSGIPTLSDSTGGTLIDGTTAPGYLPGAAPAVIFQGHSSRTGLTVTSEDNEVRGLSVERFGRGIEVQYGAGLSLRSSTIAENSTYSGILNRGTLTITNSTIAKNSGEWSGGIENTGTLTVVNSTIAGNAAVGRSVVPYSLTAGGIRNDDRYGGYQCTVANSIIAQNEADHTPDIVGALTEESDYNLIGIWNDESIVLGESNLSGTVGAPLDPGLSDWADLESGVKRYFLLPDSPALNAGSNELAVAPDGTPLATDQYSHPRIQNGVVDIGAVEGATDPGAEVVYLVDSLDDAVERDGVLTFPEALQAANLNRPVGDAPAGSFSRPDRIEFAPGLSGSFLLDGQPLTIDGDLVVQGPGADLLAFDAQGTGQVFEVLLGARVTLSEITITGGRDGAIYNRHGALTITNSTVAGNEGLHYGLGGGIVNQGVLTVEGSIVTENSTYGSGGAINNKYPGALTVTNSSIAANSADVYGGGIYNSGALTIVDSTIAANSVQDRGGGIYSIGTSTIVHSAIVENSAEDGGGIYGGGGTVTLCGASVVENSSDWSGGGICNGYSATLNVINSTIAQNSTYTSGGGINSGGPMTITNSTIMENSSGNHSGGIDGNGTLTNSIVAQNAAQSHRDIRGTLSADSDYNLVGVWSEDYALPGEHNLSGTAELPLDAGLSNWADLGGGLWGYYVLPDSPARNAGSNALAMNADGAPLTTDQGGAPRIQDGVVDLGALEGTPGGATAAVTYVVESLNGPVSADGVLTFREALQAANSNQPAGDATAGSFIAQDRIEFAPGVSGTFVVDGQPLTILGDLAIEGPDADSLVFDAQGTGRVFEMPLHGDVLMAGMTITGGYADVGSAIYNASGNLTVENSVVTENTADGEYDDGGAVYSQYGTLTVVRSTFARNSDINSGTGGIYNSDGAVAIIDSTLADHSGRAIFNMRGTVTVTDSSITGNSVGRMSGYGGGIYTRYGKLTVVNSTIAENGALGMYGRGGGVYSLYGAVTVANSTIVQNSSSSGGGIYGGTVTVTNSTIMQNSAGRGGGIADCESLVVNNSIVARNGGDPDPDISGPLADGSDHNLIGIWSDDSVLPGEHNLSGTPEAPLDPRLSDWSDLGGGLRGYFLLPDSPARNAGSNDLAVDPDGAPLATDLIGNPRIQEGVVDLGAVEGARQPTAPMTYLVESLDGTIAQDGILTFREAFEAADLNMPIGDAPAGSFAEQDRIELSPGLSGTFLLDGRPLTVHGDLAIEGPGAGQLILDAQGASGVLEIRPDTLVALSGLTVTGGRASDGGGILSRAGRLTISHSTVTGNTADDDGGGILSHGGTLTVIDSTITENSADDCGGGIGGYHLTLTVTGSPICGNDGGGIYCSSGALMVTDSTITANSSRNSSGGIYCGSGTLTVADSTITANSSYYEGGGIHSGSGTLTVTASTITGNSSSCAGGGIHSGASTLTVTDSTVTENSSQYAGGGILCGSGTMTVTRSTIEDNVRGGVYSDQGMLTITGTTIAGNSGNGVFCGGTSTIGGSTIAGNSDVGIRIDQEALSVIASHVVGNSHGGIFGYGPMTVSNSTIVENDGVGIHGSRPVTVNGSTIAGNSDTGIYCKDALTVASSTIARNSGTGIYCKDALTVGNSTIAENVGGQEGGGIYIYSSAPSTISHSTITKNSARYRGGGIYSTGTLTIRNSIVARNSADTAPDVDGTLTNQSDYNLIGVWEDDPTPYPHSLMGIRLVPLDPHLGPPGDYGGPTWTMPLLSDSPAIDAGDPNPADPPPADQRGATRVVDGDEDGAPRIDMGAFEYSPDEVLIFGRHLLYNNSTFDGNSPYANSQDDDAIAADKQALLPGQTATLANYSSYDKGINGIMIDVAGPHGLRTAADFEFRVGNDHDPQSWTLLQGYPGVAVRRGQGVNGSDRVTLVWQDGAIRNQWLQVTVLATATTGLAQPDVFYFGNAIGESGNSVTDARVNAIDALVARNNPRTLTDPAPIDFPYDFNRDQRVNATDMLIARNNQTHSLNALKLITVPDGKTAVRLDVDAAFAEKAGGTLHWLHELEEMATERRVSDEGVEDAVDLLLAGV